jgi:cell division protein FtsQ
MKRPRVRRPRRDTLLRVPAAAARVPATALHLLPPRARLAAVGMVSALVVFGGLYFFWLRDSSLVSVDKVAVTGVSGDNAHRIEARLVAAARDQTTLNVDADALRQAVSAFPEVRGVTADADFPHGLRITVEERVPVAALTSGRHHVAVASDGTLLPGESTGHLPAVPVDTLPTGATLTDPPALRSVAVLAAAPAGLRARVDQLAKGKGGLRATLRGGGTVVFGAPTALAAKWLAAAAVLRDPGAKGAKYLDVRIPRRPVAGGLPPVIDPETGEPVSPTSGQNGDATTDPLAADAADPNADPSADPSATDATTDPGSTDGTDSTGDGSQSQDSQFAGTSP